MNIPLHLGKYYRYFYKETNLLVVVGHFDEVLKGKQLYEERYGINPPKGEAARTLEQVMASAALAAVSLADRESWGWSITLPGSARGFFCGVEPEGLICGIVRPADSARAAVYVQRQKGREPMTQSFYESSTTDPVKAVEIYFEQSVQVETRIAMGDNGVGVLVQALPNSRFGEVSDLPDEKLVQMLTQMASRGELEPAGEVLIFYECRCCEDMILKTVESLPDDRQEALFEDDSHIIAECPRCSREYRIEKDRLEA